MSQQRPPVEADSDAIELARRVGLRHVDCEEQGIRRRRCGTGFTYLDPVGETIRDPALRRRLVELAIPPDWDDVWICPDPRGHLQATGRDAAGRKQYRYHDEWSRARDHRKYHHLEALGHWLPTVRTRVGRDLRLEGLPLRRVAAAAVRILDTLAIRVGNEIYTEENGSHGVTTLRREHLVRRRDRLRFRFPAKGGKDRDLVLRDPTLAAALDALRAPRGDRLFRYRDDAGVLHPLQADDVNDYLRALAGPRVSARQFRTWAGTVTVLRSLLAAPAEDAADERHRRLIEAFDEAAGRLGNTRTTTRDFYVHPGLAELFEAGGLRDRIREVESDRARLQRPGFRRDEPRLLALLPSLDRHLV